MTLISELDEGELIRRFQEILPEGQRTIIGIGDDCAQIAAPEGSFIVTTDVIVEDQHFLRAWSRPEEIGARVAAQNLADIAGMGGYCSGLVVSLALTAQTEVDWLMDVVGGMASRAQAAGAGIIGGDLSAGEKMVLSVTAFGWCPNGPVTRTGGQPGDVLAVCGEVGWSHAGLDLLLGGHVDPSTRDVGVLGEAGAHALATYRAPNPPLEAGPRAARAGAHAMMDLSDGIAKDGGRMARASGVVIDLDRQALEDYARQLEPVAHMCGGNPMTWVLSGGEDHGMLAAFPSDRPLPEGFHPIGHLRQPRTGEEPCQLLEGREVIGGWDHFAQ
ncbi:thiamine-phosphate kinase [Schaalia sp. ZJ405]|uniref:thiamine-phosphate kinase n=1 Tax=Schaalia sp. ZJ405 TaxID=2709403 RepID=UPI0013ECE6A2|nr:thiamine-phosphate kinase [Schaalia sp. ZJ405]QPK81890.1 thiamine-phosphate kinase [Schaalia sp. ZJ405]